jgi:hypothetical protein
MLNKLSVSPKIKSIEFEDYFEIRIGSAPDGRTWISISANIGEPQLAVIVEGLRDDLGAALRLAEFTITRNTIV